MVFGMQPSNQIPKNVTTKYFVSTVQSLAIWPSMNMLSPSYLQRNWFIYRVIIEESALYLGLIQYWKWKFNLGHGILDDEREKNTITRKGSFFKYIHDKVSPCLTLIRPEGNPQRNSLKMQIIFLALNSVISILVILK